MAHSEIDAIRVLLGSKPRPVRWFERRQRLDEVGSTWPVAPDVKCEAVDCDGVPGEWSLVPGSETSKALLYFHGGGYCSGSITSHRRLPTAYGRWRVPGSSSARAFHSRSRVAVPLRGSPLIETDAPEKPEFKGLSGEIW